MGNYWGMGGREREQFKGRITHRQKEAKHYNYQSYKEKYCNQLQTNLMFTISLKDMSNSWWGKKFAYEDK